MRIVLDFSKNVCMVSSQRTLKKGPAVMKVPRDKLKEGDSHLQQCFSFDLPPLRAYSDIL